MQKETEHALSNLRAMKQRSQKMCFGRLVPRDSFLHPSKTVDTAPHGKSCEKCAYISSVIEEMGDISKSPYRAGHLCDARS